MCKIDSIARESFRMGGYLVVCEWNGIVSCIKLNERIKKEWDDAAESWVDFVRNRGRFVFSIPHPCFETIIVNGKRISATRRYFGVAKYPVQWKMERLEKPFRTTSFHRTLTDYFDALFRIRLFVSRLVEPRPTEKGLLKHLQLREALVIPQSIIIESIKCEGGELS